MSRAMHMTARIRALGAHLGRAVRGFGLLSARRWWLWGLAALLLAWLCCLPRQLFKGVSYSTVVESAEGELLGARIAADGQWRFPPSDTVPERFATALVQFEDRHFWWHPGVDPGALVRATVDNLRSGHVVSGGSTLTMQVMRLSRQRERNLWQKMIEAVQATRLELRYSKKQILALYASHAPFGGNVVGLEAAAWRYFGRPASELSWGEAATLAVLPNAPASLHLSRGRDQLLAKRNRLLRRLLEHGDLSAESYEAALEEPLPEAPLPLPSWALHYVERCPRGVRTRSSLSFPVQKAVEEAVNRRSDALALEGIADMAAVVIDNVSGTVLAYVGNASPERERPGRQVDIASAPRSTGSILKPFLYAAALQEGVILPRTLLPDIPVNLGGFAPQNFDRQFYGAVPANEALARSLNVPSVFLLRAYGVPKFHALLQAAGLTTLPREPHHYGLSLILGGGEGRLDEITAAYAAMVRAYGGGLGGGKADAVSGTSRPLPDSWSAVASACPITEPLALWYTFEALKEVNRPDELDWRLIHSVRMAAWKTGTSYGFRDAWAVGMTPEYTIGVWAGNAQGQGVPGLTGARTAGPVLFDILNLLPYSGAWFPEPDSGFSEHDTGGTADDPYAAGVVSSRNAGDAMSGRNAGDVTSSRNAEGATAESAGTKTGTSVSGRGVWAAVCTDSGMLAGPECPAEQLLIPSAGLDSEPCKYHRSGEFVLTPAMEWYYKPHHPEYRGATQTAGSVSQPMEFIYPASGSILHLPRQLSGQVEGAVFRVAHHRSDATLWWHLDNTYVGETHLLHELRLAPAPGKHHLTVVDEDGHTASVAFTVEGN